MRSALILLTALITGCSSIQSLTGNSPSQTVKATINALFANDPDTAAPLFYIPDGMPEIQFKNGITQLAANMSTATWRYGIVESKRDGDFAVVILSEQGQDKAAKSLLPIFLLRTHGGWKLSPAFRDFMPLVDEDGTGAEEYGKLKAWFESRKQAIENKITPQQ